MFKLLPIMLLAAFLAAAAPGHAETRTGVNRITLNELAYGSAGEFRIKVTVALWIVKF
jgi:hypothetical protein